MKRNSVWNWKIGLMVAAVCATGTTINNITASSESVAPSPGQNEEVGAPVPPPGEPEETPPAIPAFTPPPLEISPGMDAIFRMARSGVSEEVLIAFIGKSGRAYHPSAEEIIYLKDLGVSPNAIAALINTSDGPPDRSSDVAAQGGNGRENAAVTVDERGGNTTVNVTSHNHYAAAPQPLEDQVPVDGAVAASNANETVDLTYFKGALSPYGDWIYVDGVGECWRPTVSGVNANWRPYFDGGRWIYTDAGWYWLSDYSWGWAPFHYGRWHLSTGWGWVWVPGYTWGPAWVSWRRTPTYCGWAPLPAYTWGAGYGYYGSGWSFSFGISWGSYCWVPYRYCYGYYPRYYAAPYAARQEIYNNSTVIKPTIIGDNNTVIINGPDVTTVAKAANTEIRRVEIRDTTNLRDPGPKDYVENGGRTLATFRPTVKPETTRSVTTEGLRSTAATTTGEANAGASLASTETRRGSNPTGTQSTGSRQPSGRTSSTATASTSSAPVGRDNGVAAQTAGLETARRSATTTPTTGTTPRLAGQNTTIQRNPTYRTPAVQSTPILRNGRTIQYNAPVRPTSPVVAGGISTESRRTIYPGSTAVTSSGQTVRTPTRTTLTRPSTQGNPTYAPSRQTVPAYSASSIESARSRTTTSSQPTRSFSTPSTRSYSTPSTRSYTTPTARSYTTPSYSSPSTRVTVPSITRQPTRTYTPNNNSYSRPTPTPSRSNISRTPTSIPSAPSFSRPPSSGTMRAPTISPSPGTSRAPSRR